MLTLLGRSAWGAATANDGLLVPHSRRINRLTVHHAGSQSGTTGPAQFRAWQRFHTGDRGWGDLAYHVIVGVDGAAYRGRDLASRGDTGTTYDPDRHFLVVVEGNFEKESPTAAQLTTLRSVLTWAAGKFDVSPSRITGHRDWANTPCPGKTLYADITGDLIADVEQLLADGGVVLT